MVSKIELTTRLVKAKENALQEIDNLRKLVEDDDDEESVEHCSMITAGLIAIMLIKLMLDEDSSTDEGDEMAKALYTSYSSSMGGVSFNGTPLPTADELFSDNTKGKIADAWRATALRSKHYLL